MKVFIAICNDRILDVYEDPVRAHDRITDEREHAIRHEMEPAEWKCLVPFDPENEHEVERWAQVFGPIARLSVYPFTVCSWTSRGPL